MKIKIIILFAIFFFKFYPALSAAKNSNTFKFDAGGSKIENYKQAEKRIIKAKKLEKKGKIKKSQKLYKESLKYLYKAYKEDPTNPDVLNYLGFSTRKTGNYVDAEIYYLLGLELDPRHVGINEYLGELYIETNRVDKAKERLKILDGCNCEEYKELQALISKN